MRSVGHITHRVFWGALGSVTGVVDIVTTAASTPIIARIVHNVAFIGAHDHAVVIRRKGP